MKKNIKILSVGGSIIIPKTGFDISFLKKFKKIIVDEVKKGTTFILVIGGGATCRQYQHTLSNVSQVSDDDLDWLGIHATWFNAQFVKYMFGDIAYREVLHDPKQKVKTNKSIIIAGGEKPGQSTDMVAVTYAKTYGVTEVINLSNIAYVYDKDPNKFKHTQKIEVIDWKTFRRDIVGMAWKPGKNVPFDLTASRAAETLKLRVTIMDGTDLKEVKNALRGKKCKGTVVS